MELDRRSFLGVSGGGLLCYIGGKPVAEASRADVELADAAAAQVKLPRGVRRDRVDQLTFATPEPQAGGVRREYWVEARSQKWDVAPNTRRDEWMGVRIRGRTRWTAFTYRRWSEGFGRPLGPGGMPGPTLEGEVGDVIVVHFRNAGGRYPQPVTMHPHGVRYTPEYDGSFYGDFTRAGGFVRPGEEFTYFWECTPESVGVWPYHDHGPNHSVNTQRGLFGQLIVRPKGEPPPDVETSLWQHGLLPSITGLDLGFQCINGRAFAGNTPVIRARVGQRVAFYTFGNDSAYHNWHLHGHRWRDGNGNLDNQGFGTHETRTASFVEDNPGRWLYHCHVFTHQDAGMAGWYLVDP